MPVNACNVVSKVVSPTVQVLKVTVPVAGAVQEYQIVLREPPPKVVGSPVSPVDPTLLHSVVPVAPVMTFAAEKSSPEQLKEGPGVVVCTLADLLPASFVERVVGQRAHADQRASVG